MNSPSGRGYATLPLDLAHQVDQLCARFEKQWQQGESPLIGDFLRSAGQELHPALIHELILVEISYRQQRGETPTFEEYRARFPQLDVSWLAQQVTQTLSTIENPERKGAARALAQPAPAAAAAPAEPPSPSQGPARIRCPHCHNPIVLGDARREDVLCPGCGSSFRVRDTHATCTLIAMKPLGKFQLLERVGLGAFGAVWRARDTELDRVVALKIPHAGLLSSGADLERFHREARAAAQLRHPGIVTVHEVAVIEGLPTLVADFIQGVCLKDYLCQRRLTFAEAADLVSDIAEALDYAHAKGVVHRDIKPANIMLETMAAGAETPRRNGSTQRSNARRSAHHGFRAGAPRRDRRYHDRRGTDPRHASVHEPRAGGRQGA